jgi:integrase
MTSRQDFTDEEWTRIRRAPLVAGVAISLADPGGPIEVAKETMATLRSATLPPSQEELLASVALDVQALAQHRQNPLGDFKPRSGQQVLEELRVVNELVTAKATPEEVAAFLADLSTHRDRAMALAMLLGGLRAAEVRALRLAEVDRGLRRLRVVGKGGRERIVPVDRAFFAELTAYLRVERPPGCATPECFVVLRGPTTGQAMTEAGLRRIFRTHRARSGAARVRPHRLRCSYTSSSPLGGSRRVRRCRWWWQNLEVS